MALKTIHNFQTLPTINGAVKIMRYRSGAPLEIDLDDLEDYLGGSTAIILNTDTFLMAPGSVGRARHKTASYLKTFLQTGSGALRTDVLLVSVDGQHYKVDAGELKTYYYPPTPLTPVSTGLLYQTQFPNLTGWTGDTGSFASDSDKAVIPFAPFRNYDFAPSGDPAEAYGARQGTPFIDGITFYLLYDGGPGQSVADWAINKATSTDRGKTWTRVFDFGPAYDDGLGGTWPATACGFLAKFGGTFYLYRVVLTTSPGGIPYYGDIWSAASLTGAWTYEAALPLTPATFTSDECLPGSIIKVGSTYHLIIQGRGSSGLYKIGRMSSTSPVGPWTLDTTIISDTLNVTDIPENPKVFFSTALSKYVMLVNTFSDLGAGYRSRCTYAFYSDSITDWSAKTIKKIQYENPLDGTPAIGVMTQVSGPDGAVIVGGNGFIPAYYDSEGTINSTGGTDQAWGRKIRGVCLEPQTSCLKYTGGIVGSGKQLYRSLSHTTITIEAGIEFPNTTIDRSMGFWFRANGSGNGYLFILRSGEDSVLYSYPSGTTIGGNAGLNDTIANHIHRVKIVAIGTSIKCYVDGQLQVDITDSTYSSGTHIAINAFDAVDVKVWGLRVTTNKTVTINNLSTGSIVVLRADGKLPVEQETVDGTGTVVFDIEHAPLETIEVDGFDTTPSGGIWGGDIYEQ